MKLRKAVITAAARDQRRLPLQTLVDRDGAPKSVLCVILEEALRAGIEEIGVVVSPGDQEDFREAVGDHAAQLRFLVQDSPRGYGHAVFCAREFVGEEPFLHMVGDHIYVHDGDQNCAQELVSAASAHDCAVSSVVPTRETLLPYYGAIGGQRLRGRRDLYLVERVLEKPTPTEAEQALLVPGLRSGHYLCFFGMHVLTPAVMAILGERVAAAGDEAVELSPALSQLAARERYLALVAHGRRYPLDVPYGLLNAQLALALTGQDRAEVLASLCELLAQRQLDAVG